MLSESPLEALAAAVVVAADLEAVSGRYEALLGRGADARGARLVGGGRVCVFELDRTRLVLWEPEPAAPAERSGLWGLALQTRDLVWCRQRLAARGLRLEPEREARTAGPSHGLLERRAMRLSHEQTRGVPLCVVERGRDLHPATRASSPGSVAGLDHVVLHTPAPDASIALYRDRLGLRLALDRTFDARGVRLIFFRLGGVTLELAARIGPDAAGPDRPGGLAWRVPDIDAARERVVAEGFDATPVRAGHKPRTRVCTLTSAPAGVPTLLIGPEVPPRRGAG